MWDNQLFDPEKLSITEFKFIKEYMETPEDFIEDKVKGHLLENTLQLAFNLKEKLVKVDFKIEIKTQSNGENTQESWGVFHFIFIYSVENLDELAKPNNHLLDIHPALNNALTSITYSTSRGVLLIKLQGTSLQNFVLPVINPNKLLHKGKK
jgi:hypothetical protein